jgi:uncharacterized membrane protein
MIVRLQQFVFLLNLDKITKKKTSQQKNILQKQTSRYEYIFIRISGFSCIEQKQNKVNLIFSFSFYKTLTNTLTRTSYIFFVYIKSNKHCTKENILL